MQQAWHSTLPDSSMYRRVLMGRFTGYRPAARCQPTRKAWGWLRESPSMPRAISTSATAAELYSKSRAIARFTSSPRLSPAFRPIIWRLQRTGLCSSPALPFPASMLFTKSIPTGRFGNSIAGWVVRKGWPSMPRGALYVAASLQGGRGIVRLTPSAEASLVLSGSNLVGLAFAPAQSAILATTSAVHRVAWNIAGRPLWG